MNPIAMIEVCKSELLLGIQNSPSTEDQGTDNEEKQLAESNQDQQ